AESMGAEAASRLSDDPLVLTSWGLTALRRDEPQVAWARLERARELAGERAPALWFWVAGLTLAALDRLDPALAVAREGVERFPHDAVLRNNCAVLLEATGDFAEAERMLREAIDEGATAPHPYKNLGDLLYRSGRYDDAATAYDRAASIDPDLGDDLFFKLGNLAFRRRDADRARECWERTLSLNPGHQLARANLELLPVST
ncbi:MAG: tetratricopeptide repeat protein, partial [Gemmatimonadales bacterium]